MTLETDVENLWQRYRNDEVEDAADSAVRSTLDAFLEGLETGEVRAAERVGDTGPDAWTVNEWVKRGILLNFSLRETEAREYGGVSYYDVLPLRSTTAGRSGRPSGSATPAPTPGRSTSGSSGGSC